jgi:hypothetical protein
MNKFSFICPDFELTYVLPGGPLRLSDCAIHREGNLNIRVRLDLVIHDIWP